MRKEKSGKSTEYAFTQMPVPKALAKFMIPTVLSQLAFMILNLADAFFVGRTGDNYQIAAMTITFPLIMMMNCVTTIFATGGNANIASALGNGERGRAKKTAAFSLYTSIAIVVTYSAVMLIVREPVLMFLGASDDSIGFCKDYMFWALIASSIPFTFNQVISQLFLAEGESTIAGFGIAMAGIINVILDPIFIFPFRMGVTGAGAATFMSNCIAFVYYLFQHYKRRKSTVVSLSLKDFRAGDGIASKVLAIGIPAGLVLFLTNICDFVRNYSLGTLGGDTDLAAWGAVQKVSNAVMLIAIGISQGVRPLVAYNYSAGLVKRTKALIRGAMVTMISYIILIVVLIHIFPDAIVKMFVTDPDAVRIAVYFLKIWTFSMFGIGMLELLNAIFQALGKWKICLANTIINKGFLLTPVLILLVHLYGINGIPYSQVITENSMALIMLIIYLKINNMAEK